MGFQALQISHPPTCAYLNQILSSCFVSIQLFFFFLAQVQTRGLPTGISRKKKNTHKTHSDKAPSLPPLSLTQTITNMTYQSPAQWSRTKEPLFMEHLLFGAFSWPVACDVAPGRCDSQHVGIILKQPSICQGYAFILKVLSSLRFKTKKRVQEKIKKTSAASKFAQEREVCRSKGVCSGQTL